MTAYPLTALATLLAVLIFFWTTIKVGQARGKYDIKAPATSGHEMFDRAFRVQMNTLEALAVFLPSLWIYAITVGDLGSGVTGLVWFWPAPGMDWPMCQTPAKEAQVLRFPCFARSECGLGACGAW